MRRKKFIIEKAKKVGINLKKNQKKLQDIIYKQNFLLLSTQYNKTKQIVENLLEGHISNYYVRIFDYELILDEETNSFQTVIIIENTKIVFPQFALIPHKLPKERFTQRFRTALMDSVSKKLHNYHNINVQIKDYDLSCPFELEQKVKNIFKKPIIAYFSSHKKYTIEGSGNFLLIYERERLISQKEFDNFLNESLSIIKLFENTAG